MKWTNEARQWFYLVRFMLQHLLLVILKNIWWYSILFLSWTTNKPSTVLGFYVSVYCVHQSLKHLHPRCHRCSQFQIYYKCISEPLLTWYWSVWAASETQKPNVEFPHICLIKCIRTFLKLYINAEKENIEQHQTYPLPSYQLLQLAA